MWIKAVLVIVLTLNLSACATSKSSMVKDQGQQMQAQIEEMAKELQEKDETINDLNKKLEAAAGAKDVKKSKY